MSNIIRPNKSAPNKEWLSMSNQGTDCFLELLEKASGQSEMTENQKNLIGFLKERRTTNQIAPGTASFDIDEMPWNSDTLSEDVAYMVCPSKAGHFSLRICQVCEFPEYFTSFFYLSGRYSYMPLLQRSICA